MRVKELVYDVEINGLAQDGRSRAAPIPVMEFYGDESCCNGDEHYLVIGGIAIRQDHVAEIEDRLRAVRNRYPPRLAISEVKWTKCSRAVLPFYKEYSDVFFAAAARDLASFTALWVDKRTFDHRTFNANSPEIGFNKMVYQLLLHKVGKIWGKDYRIAVKLDYRTSKDDPNDLCIMLNHDLRRSGIRTFPFKRIEFKDSKKSDLIQLNDLLIGVLGCHHNRREGRSEHKLALAHHILEQARQTCQPRSMYSIDATTFKVWSFRFQRRGR